MKLDQTAFYCTTPAAAQQLKENLGLDKAEWITDRVVGKSQVIINPRLVRHGNNVAELQFCYVLGIELEIIRYIEGPHWHQRYQMGALECFRSHDGVHLEDHEPFPLLPHAQLVQETFTLSHTSDYLTNPQSLGYGRKYHYRIFELSPNTWIKFIRRIHPQEQTNAVAA